jgi:hypothetical protein
MKRYALPLALVFVAIGAVRIASTWRQLSITYDESYHYSCGLDYLTMGKLCVGENPLLAPIAAAALPTLAGVRSDPTIPERKDERTYRERTKIGYRQLQEALIASPDPWRLVALMRAGILPFFVLAALTVFFASRHWLGAPAAVGATALFTLIPTVLAHSGLATTDMALTATLPATFFLLWWWTEAPSWPRAVLVGVAGGLALFAKFSSIPYLGAAVVVALVIARPKLSAKLIPGALAAAAIAAFILLAGYRFNFARVVASFQELADHARAGHGGAYLLGEFRNKGWWYFFPVALAVKAPIALLIAVAVGLPRRAARLPAALLLGILLVAMAGRINLGTRHILPVFVALAMIGGLGLARLGKWSWLLLIWMAISGAHAHPDYLSYFNEFAGDRPDAILLDSDLWWDQDWVLAGRFLRSQGAQEFTLDLGAADFTNRALLERVYGMPRLVENGRGWHVVDATRLRYERNGRLPAPAHRIGGLFVYHALPEGR